MDAIDILGSLLGHKSGGSGGGPDLGDIFGRREAPAPAPQRRETTGVSPPSKADIHRQAQELEDLLNVAREREASRPQRSAPGKSASPSVPTAAGRANPVPVGVPKTSSASSGRPSLDADDIEVESPFAPRGPARSAQNEQALVLVRAMLNAAKADGRISQTEQQAILQEAGNSAEATQFLRDELAKPLDVREFAWSVPLGMEEQVYAMSLLAIDVDEAAEERYLGELAHGLRITDDVCEQLQQRYRVRKPR